MSRARQGPPAPFGCRGAVIYSRSGKVVNCAYLRLPATGAGHGEGSSRGECAPPCAPSPFPSIAIPRRRESVGSISPPAVNQTDVPTLPDPRLPARARAPRPRRPPTLAREARARLLVCFLMQYLGDFRVGPQVPRHALESGGVQSVRPAAQLGRARGFLGGHVRVHARTWQDPNQRESFFQVARQINVGRLAHKAAFRWRAPAPRSGPPRQLASSRIRAANSCQAPGRNARAMAISHSAPPRKRAPPQDLARGLGVPGGASHAGAVTRLRSCQNCKAASRFCCKSRPAVWLAATAASRATPSSGAISLTRGRCAAQATWPRGPMPAIVPSPVSNASTAALSCTRAARRLHPGAPS